MSRLIEIHLLFSLMLIKFNERIIKKRPWNVRVRVCSSLRAQSLLIFAWSPPFDHMLVEEAIPSKRWFREKTVECGYGKIARERKGEKGGTTCVCGLGAFARRPLFVVLHVTRTDRSLYAYALIMVREINLESFFNPTQTRHLRSFVVWILYLAWLKELHTCQCTSLVHWDRLV